MRDAGPESAWAVAEVIGQVSGKPLAEHVREACAGKGVEASVERVELRHLAAVREREEGGREAVLGDNGMSSSSHREGGCWVLTRGNRL